MNWNEFVKASQLIQFIFLFACSYRRAGDGFIKVFNTEQQKRLHKPTLSADAELVKDSVGPG